MSRIVWTPLSGARTAAAANTIFTGMGTQSSAVDATVLMPESLDGTVIVDRPVWERMDTLAIGTRNGATLPVVVPPAWGGLDHNGTLLRFNFLIYALGANEALRFGHWSSWETTLNNGMGVVGEVLLRWEYSGAALSGSGGHIQRDAAPGTNPIHQHGQTYIEGWIEGPATLNGFVQVQYAYAGAQAFLAKSLTFFDLYKHWA